MSKKSCPPLLSKLPNLDTQFVMYLSLKTVSTTLPRNKAQKRPLKTSFASILVKFLKHKKCFFWPEIVWYPKNDQLRGAPRYFDQTAAGDEGLTPTECSSSLVNLFLVSVIWKLDKPLGYTVYEIDFQDFLS